MGNEVMTGTPVADFQPAAEFYGRLLGRAPDFVAGTRAASSKLRGGCLSGEI